MTLGYQEDSKDTYSKTFFHIFKFLYDHERTAVSIKTV